MTAGWLGVPGQDREGETWSALVSRLRELVRSRRLELPRELPHSDLNAARLPIPPRPHVLGVGEALRKSVGNEKGEIAAFLPLATQAAAVRAQVIFPPRKCRAQLHQGGLENVPTDG